MLSSTSTSFDILSRFVAPKSSLCFMARSKTTRSLMTKNNWSKNARIAPFSLPQKFIVRRLLFDSVKFGEQQRHEDSIGSGIDVVALNIEQQRLYTPSVSAFDVPALKKMLEERRAQQQILKMKKKKERKLFAVPPGFNMDCGAEKKIVHPVRAPPVLEAERNPLITHSYCDAMRKFKIVGEHVTDEQLMELMRLVQPVPDSRHGLGYHWTPVVITAETPELMSRFKEASQISFLHASGEVHIPPNDAQLVKHVVSQTAQLDHPMYFNDLNVHQTFLDPRDVQREIDLLRVWNGVHIPIYVPAIMDSSAICTIKMAGSGSDKETIHLSRDRCLMNEISLLTLNGEFHLKARMEPAELTDGRIFNWQLTVRIFAPRPVIADVVSPSVPQTPSVPQPSSSASPSLEPSTKTEEETNSSSAGIFFTILEDTLKLSAMCLAIFGVYTYVTLICCGSLFIFCGIIALILYGLYGLYCARPILNVEP